MRPVMEGMCLYESLKDGTLSLEDIALMNDALAVRADNEMIHQEMVKAGRGS